VRAGNRPTRHLGLVDYVSDPGTTAFDKALVLAEMIARNGKYYTVCLLLSIFTSFLAPLAVRAAKHAISRSEDLPLETG
jgi:methylglutaconyl-CoA hydratase